jgi:hypothetical protein
VDCSGFMKCKGWALSCDGSSRTGRESVDLSGVRERISQMCAGDKSSSDLCVDFLAHRAPASSNRGRAQE